MVTLNNLAVACVLISSLAAAAPMRTPDSHTEIVACLGLGCKNPEQRHPYVGGIMHVEGSDVFPLSNEKVEEWIETGTPEAVNPNASKTLVKNSIVKKPLEEPLGEVSQGLDHGKRDLQKQLEQDVVEEEDEATTLTSNSPLHPTHTFEMAGSA